MVEKAKIIEQNRIKAECKKREKEFKNEK